MYEPSENIYFHILAENNFRIESLWPKYVHSGLFYFFIGKLPKMIKKKSCLKAIDLAQGNGVHSP